MPTFGSLFAGIGGIDLGLERAGWTGRWQVEWDDFCCHVLEHHWPAVPRYRDIRDVDWSAVEPVDLIAGGFPCQPVSSAGKQLAQADERWLWPEFYRCVRALRPSLVLVENVAGLLGAHGGLGDVLGDLAALGYDAEWDCIPAAAVGAPHFRDRVWIVAYSDRSGSAHGSQGNARGGELCPRAITPRPAGYRRVEATADVADASRVRGRCWHGEWTDAADADAPGEGSGPGGNGGWWATEPPVGRLAYGVPNRLARLRALGNAVVPQVVEMIGRQLLDLLDDEDAA